MATLSVLKFNDPSGADRVLLAGGVSEAKETMRGAGALDKQCPARGVHVQGCREYIAKGAKMIARIAGTENP